jgi:hypothetical protein
MMVMAVQREVSCLNTSCQYHQGWRECGIRALQVGATGKCLSFAELDENKKDWD